MKKSIIAAAAAFAVCICAVSCQSKDSKAADSDTAEATALTTAAEEVAAPMEVKVDTTGYTTTKSGLKYKEVRPGNGAKPASDQAVVKVHYAGKHMDGTEFDSSYQRNEPATFPLNQVIAGWTEGVQLMKTGAKYQFLIPSDLAYGPQGTPGGPIQPNEDLYFEVELLEIVE